MLAIHRFLLTRTPRLYFHVRNIGRKAVGTRRKQRTLFSELIRPGDLVFDVGANIGEFSAAFRDCGARVVSVEPQPRLTAHLRRRFGADPEVTVVATALSDHAGEATLFCTSADALATLEEARVTGAVGAGAELEWNDTIQVPLRTLEALVAEYGPPVLVKIDVEGHEAGVVRGLTTTRPSLFFEVNRESVDEVLDLLADRGYTDFLLREGERPDWVSRRPVPAAEMRALIAATETDCDCLALSPDAALVGDRRPAEAPGSVSDARDR
ncbi:FkbM family methyltransferase [Blastococcus xanthinilyticus]|uniref:FkbM family methyltransferase n=1 Tax=Blastococcus xanthinilyticus TaxID=1564164 RepID=A0A5S5D1F4_9ACTN|nr:FkbM family methyltransferase [Blastococcus xanthinilyticus]TYP89841.1 FkbM family methyltransferase [Blastococcus xanthinilyticus]